FDGFAGIGLKKCVIFLFFKPGKFKNLFILRWSPELTRQLTDGIARFMSLLTHLTRAPVLSPKFIQNCAAYAQSREAAELFIRLAITAQAFKQTHQADLLHVFAIKYLIGLQ